MHQVNAPVIPARGSAIINTYSWSGPGSWTLEAGGTGNVLTQAQWQASPYNQDADSTFKSGPALYEVRASQKSGYCLDNSNGSSADGNHIQTWKCLHNTSQQ
jgi:hypothetical protein